MENVWLGYVNELIGVDVSRLYFFDLQSGASIR